MKGAVRRLGNQAAASWHHRVATRECPKDGGPPGYKTPRRTLPHPHHPTTHHLHVHPHRPPLQYPHFATMAFTEFPTFSIEDIFGFNTNGPRDAYNPNPHSTGPSQPDATTDVWGGWTDVGGPCWDLSALSGPSQSYAGVEVWGDLKNYPDFPTPLGVPEPLSPNSAPTSLHPANWEAPGEGKSYQYHHSIVRRLTLRSQATFPHSTGMHPCHPCSKRRSPRPNPQPPRSPQPFRGEVSAFPSQIKLSSLTRCDQTNFSPKNCTPPTPLRRTARTHNPRSSSTMKAWVATSPLWQGFPPCPQSTLPTTKSHPTKKVSWFLLFIILLAYSSLATQCRISSLRPGPTIATSTRSRWVDPHRSSWRPLTRLRNVSPRPNPSFPNPSHPLPVPNGPERA